MKKDIIDELIKFELIKLDDICEALEKLKLVTIPPKGYISESDVRCWYESDPKLSDKKQVLDCLGYDIYGLQSNAAKKQLKFKYENIEPNSRGDFEMIYKNSQNLINFIKNNLQQLAAAHKAMGTKIEP